LVKHLATYLLFLLLCAVGVNNSFAQAPVVSSFSPAKGIIGTQVTITGSNFNALAGNNIVFFGATRAKILSTSVNSLVVEVPIGATFQPISVLNNVTHLIGYSKYPFHTTFASKGYFSALDFDGREDFATSTGPSSVAFGDLDNDGKPDMVVTNQDAATVSIYRNTSTSGVINAQSFAQPFSFQTNISPSAVEIGDLDADGKPDIILANYISGNISIYQNQYAGGGLSASSFGPKFDVATAEYPYVIKIGDLDNDGKPDMAISYSFVGDALSYIKNISTPGNLTATSFGTRIDAVSGNGYFNVGLADLTDDGKVDVILSDATKSQVSVYKNISTMGTLSLASLEPKVSYTTAANPLVVNSGDIDGDGKTDLVLSNFGTSLGPVETDGFYISVLLNKIVGNNITNTSFGPVKNFPTGRVPQASVLGDLDGDGKLDVVATNYKDNTISLLHNTSTIGNAMFDNKIDLATGLNPQSVKIADVDGDGKPDIIQVNFKSNTVSIYRNNASSLQSITFPPLNTVVYGTADFSPGATSNNLNNPITYTSNNTDVATITPDGLIHIIGVGTSTITASQSGNENYEAALPKQQLLTVMPAPLNLKADNKTKAYGFANPPLTITYTGLVNGDTEAAADVSFTLTTIADETSAPGSYLITITGNTAAPNYTATFSNGTLEVTKLNQTITFGPLEDKTLEDIEFPLNATASSGLPVTYTSSNPEVAVIEGNVVRILKPGTVTITATQAGNDIYGAATMSQTLSVTSIKVTVPANAITPNNDGINDTWVIYGLDNDYTATVTLFNRYGNNVFQSKGYPKPFNGTRNGKLLPPGVYYYLIAFTDNRPTMAGYLSIIY